VPRNIVFWGTTVLVQSITNHFFNVKNPVEGVGVKLRRTSIDWCQREVSHELLRAGGNPIKKFVLKRQI